MISGPELTGDAFEGFLYLRELRWKVSIPECVHADRFGGCGPQKLSRSPHCFPLADSCGTPDNPAELGPRSSSRQLEERCAAADLDVIGMSAQAEDSESRPSRGGDAESQESVVHLANAFALLALRSPQ